MGSDVSFLDLQAMSWESKLIAYRDMGDRAAVRYGLEKAHITVDESVGMCSRCVQSKSVS